VLVGRFRTFDSLAIRDYRLLWLGQVNTSMGQWMDQVTRGWLIYELTGSALQLGAAAAVRGLPLMFFSIAAPYPSGSEPIRACLYPSWPRRSLQCIQGVHKYFVKRLARFDRKDRTY